MQEAQEVHSPWVVSCGDTAEVFEFVEASLDNVALLVGFEVIRDWPPAGRIAGDDGFSSHAGDQRAQGIGSIRLVGQNPSRRQTFKQGRSERRIATLAGGQDEFQRAAQRVDGDVDLGRQTTSGTPQSLLPPFEPLPVAAC